MNLKFLSLNNQAVPQELVEDLTDMLNVLSKTSGKDQGIIQFNKRIYLFGC